jgi:hypothetical protein
MDLCSLYTHTKYKYSNCQSKFNRLCFLGDINNLKKHIKLEKKYRLNWDTGWDWNAGLAHACGGGHTDIVN